MQQTVSKIACLGGPKEAALYFDHVFPIDLCTPSVFARTEPGNPSFVLDDLLALHVPPIGDPLFELVIESLLGGRGEAFGQYIHQSVTSGALLLTQVALAARGHDAWVGTEQRAIELADTIGPAYGRTVRLALEKNDVSRTEIRALNREIQKAVVKAGFGDGPTWNETN